MSLAAASQRSRAPLLRISEIQNSLKPTAGPNTIGNCLVVTSTGHVHLELRRQEFFDGRAVLTAYEGKLTDEELQRLRALLNTADVRSLRQFVAPDTVLAETMHVVVADIWRGTERQRIGYFEWTGAAPTNAATVGDAWSQAAVAMQQLVTFFRALKNEKGRWARVAYAGSGVCGE
jgi:hypothetical protein